MLGAEGIFGTRPTSLEEVAARARQIRRQSKFCPRNGMYLQFPVWQVKRDLGINFIFSSPPTRALPKQADMPRISG